jgi:hypothetical protein
VNSSKELGTAILLPNTRRLSAQPMGPAFAPPPETGPNAAGNFTLLAPANVWELKWDTPGVVFDGKSYNQLRMMTGTTEFTDANFVASGTVHGSYQLGAEEADWLVDLNPAGFNGNYYTVCTTATPINTGPIQFGLVYKNTYGMMGAIATASATF